MFYRNVQIGTAPLASVDRFVTGTACVSVTGYAVAVWPATGWMFCGGGGDWSAVGEPPPPCAAARVPLELADVLARVSGQHGMHSTPQQQQGSQNLAAGHAPAVARNLTKCQN